MTFSIYNGNSRRRCADPADEEEGALSLHNHIHSHTNPFRIVRLPRGCPLNPAFSVAQAYLGPKSLVSGPDACIQSLASEARTLAENLEPTQIPMSIARARSPNANAQFKPSRVPGNERGCSLTAMVATSSLVAEYAVVVIFDHRVTSFIKHAHFCTGSPWHTLLTCPIFDMRMLVYFPRRNCQAKTLWSNAMLSSLHQCHLQVETRGIHASGRAGNLTAADAPHSCHTCVRSRKGTVSTQEG